jgi:hypothetical protein
MELAGLEPATSWVRCRCEGVILPTSSRLSAASPERTGARECCNGDVELAPRGAVW